MKIRSKYLNKTFGNWTCTYVGIATVQGKKATWAGHRSYYYIFERRTSDDKADKIIRLNANEASLVYKGKVLVEEIAEKRKAERKEKYDKKITYYYN